MSNKNCIIITILVYLIPIILLSVLNGYYYQMILIFEIIIFLALYIFLLINYRKKYISHKVIVTQVILTIMTIILMIILTNCNIIVTRSGLDGLSDALSILFYMLIIIIYFPLTPLTNLIKFIIKKLKE